MTMMDQTQAAAMKMRPDFLVNDESGTADRLIRRAGLPATILQHAVQPSRGMANEILGDTIMTKDEHKFVYTLLRGSGTGMRVGVASADGLSNWGFRLFDGRLSEHLPSTNTMTQAERLRATDPAEGKTRLKHGVPIALGGGELPMRLCQGIGTWDRSAGLRIEVTVNMSTRTLHFHAGEGKAFDACVQLPEQGVRPWFESRLIHDCIAISEHRVRPGTSILVVRKPLKVTAPSPYAQPPSRSSSPRRTASPSQEAPSQASPAPSHKAMIASPRALSPSPRPLSPWSPRASSPRPRASSPSAFGSSAPRFPRSELDGEPTQRGRASSTERVRALSPGTATGNLRWHKLNTNTVDKILQEQEELLKTLKRSGSADRPRTPTRCSSPVRQRTSSKSEHGELQAARARIALLEKQCAVLKRLEEQNQLLRDRILPSSDLSGSLASSPLSPSMPTLSGDTSTQEAAEMLLMAPPSSPEAQHAFSTDMKVLPNVQASSEELEAQQGSIEREQDLSVSLGSGAQELITVEEKEAAQPRPILEDHLSVQQQQQQLAQQPQAAPQPDTLSRPLQVKDDVLEADHIATPLVVDLESPPMRSPTSGAGGDIGLSLDTPS